MNVLHEKNHKSDDVDDENMVRNILRWSCRMLLRASRTWPGRLLSSRKREANQPLRQSTIFGTQHVSTERLNRLGSEASSKMFACASHQQALS